jgi:glycosyltransferase involved in cell wall biosynthesis
VGAGELRDDLEALAHTIAPGQVSFVGYVPHGEPLFDLYREHDVLVHAAKTEGVPQVVVEAQFVGLPVVATDVGGVRGAVADGKSALLVPPGSAEALADAVDAITADDELRARLVDRGLDGTSGVTLQRQADRLAGFIISAAS